MTRNMSYITPPYQVVTPYLSVNDAGGCIDFILHVFGGEERERIIRPDGNIVHADLIIGGAIVMVADASDGLAPMPGAVYVFVPDTDATYRRALEAGARSLMPPANQFYGDRNAGVVDPFGNRWWIATHVEDVAIEDLQGRADTMSRHAR
jgi:PhnB protein